jgi:hypothetical protein
VYTDDDDDVYVDTPDEWDIDDRVGIVIRPEDIRVEKYDEQEEEREENVAEGSDDAE